MARRSLPPLSHPFGTLTLMKKRPTLHSTGVHRLPEGPASWQIDDATRQLALAGIARPVLRSLRLSPRTVPSRQPSNSTSTQLRPNETTHLAETSRRVGA